MAMQMPETMKRSNLRFALSVPLFFMIMFPLCYITALHMPTPHDIPVAVAGAGAAAFIAQAGPELEGKVDFILADSPGHARDMVLDQTASAAYIPGSSGESADLMLANANGKLLTQILPEIFQPIAAGSGSELEIHDLAPLASGDGPGIGLMFFMLIVMLVGFMSANILGNAAFFLSLGRRVAICSGIAVVAPIVLWAFTGPWLDIVVGSPGEVTAVIAIGAVASFITALITSALVGVVGKWALFPGMLLFVFLNIPSSNASYPSEMVPPFFSWISEWHLGAAMVNGVRSILYFDGAGLTRPLVTIAVWLAVAVVAIVAVAFYLRHRNRAEQETSQAEEDGKRSDQDVVSGSSAPALAGDVTNARGMPLNNAAVTVLDMTGAQVGNTALDDDGQFRIAGLDPGTYLVVATAPDYRPDAQSATLEQRENGDQGDDPTVRLNLCCPDSGSPTTSAVTTAG